MSEEKDWNLIAKIEKQIKEKYGADAIKSPSQDWTDEQEEEHLEKLRLAALKIRDSAREREKVEVSEGVFCQRNYLQRRVTGLALFVVFILLIGAMTCI